MKKLNLLLATTAILSTGALAVLAEPITQNFTATVKLFSEDVGLIKVRDLKVGRVYANKSEAGKYINSNGRGTAKYFGGNESAIIKMTKTFDTREEASAYDDNYTWEINIDEFLSSDTYCGDTYEDETHAIVVENEDGTFSPAREIFSGYQFPSLEEWDDTIIGQECTALGYSTLIYTGN